MSKEKIVQLQDKDGNIVYPKLKHNNYTDEDKEEVNNIKNKINKTGDSMTGDLKIKGLSVYDGIAGSISAQGDTGEVSTEYRRQVNVSGNSTANGYNSQVNASLNSEASGNRSQVNASHNSEASGDRSQVNASFDSIANTNRSQINASSKVINNRMYTTVWGDASTGDPSTQNRKVEISSKDGTIKASGSITGNSSFADFAEYMESSDGKAIPLGTIVALDEGQKIRVAQEGDNPVGIISGTAGVILNAQGFEWKNRYLYDRYGQPIYVKKYMTYIKEKLTEEEMENEIEPEIVEYKLYSEGEEIPEVGDTVDGKEIVKIEEIETQQLNPEWDEKAEYIPREDRDEWNVVGMKGQIYVNVDDTVEEQDFIQAGKDGIGTKGNHLYKNWQVMEITTPYNKDLGYGIARVVI